MRTYNVTIEDAAAETLDLLVAEKQIDAPSFSIEGLLRDYLAITAVATKERLQAVEVRALDAEFRTLLKEEKKALLETRRQNDKKIRV